MTALPEPQLEPTPWWADRLLTIAEYAGLGEPAFGYTELEEGRLVMSPSPVPRHNIASFRLAQQLDPQLPSEYLVVQDVDVDLELSDPEGPGFSRRPDLVVVERDAIERVDKEGGLLLAAEVLVVIEIVSRGSRRLDTVIKRGEYADAGIGHYWIVDVEEPVSLVSCHLAGEFGYQGAPAVTGEFVTSEPFSARVDLDGLG